MDDLSKLSTEELLALRNKAAPPQGGDLSGYTTEQLIAMRDRLAGQPQQAVAPQAPQQAPQQQDQRWGWQKWLDESGLQTMKDSTQGIAQGITLGFGDEIMAAGMTPFGMIKGAITGADANKGFMQRAADSYNSALAFNRGENKAAAERSPIAHTVGEITGGVMTAGNLAKGGVTLLNAAKPTMTNMALRGAGEGALYGAVTGFGRGEGLEDRKNQAVLNALLGAGTGAVTGAVAGKVAQRAAEKTIPSAETIRTQASAAYKAAEDAGVVFRPDSYSKFYDDIFSKSAQRGLNQTLTPHSVAALKSLEELKGIPLTLQSLETQRKILNSAAAQAARAGNKADAAIANSAVRSLDDFVANNSNVLMSGGDPTKAIEALKAARAGWRRASASEAITEITDNLAQLRAQNYSQSGYDNALRTEFSQLLRNKSKMRFFTEAEQKQIRKVVDGSATEKALRLLGKFAMRGPISGSPHFALGYAASPYMAVASTALAEAGKQGAMMMRSNNARIVDLLARSGGQIPAGNISPAQKLIIESLLSGQRALTSRQQEPVR